MSFQIDPRQLQFVIEANFEVGFDEYVNGTFTLGCADGMRVRFTTYDQDVIISVHEVLQFSMGSHSYNLWERISGHARAQIREACEGRTDGNTVITSVEPASISNDAIEDLRMMHGIDLRQPVPGGEFRYIQPEPKPVRKKPKKKAKPKPPPPPKGRVLNL